MITQEQFHEWINQNLHHDLEYTDDYLDSIIESGTFMVRKDYNELQMTLYFDPDYMVVQDITSCYFIGDISITILDNNKIMVNFGDNQTVIIDNVFTHESATYEDHEQDINFEL